MKQIIRVNKGEQVKIKILESRGSVMKKIDILIVGIVGLFSVGLVLFLNQLDTNSHKEVVISSKGEEVARVKLDGQDYEFRIENEHGYNLVRVDANGVYVEEADCPDQDCVEVGVINKIGQSIICAPNYLVIEVVGSTSGELDAIAV